MFSRVRGDKFERIGQHDQAFRLFLVKSCGLDGRRLAGNVEHREHRPTHGNLHDWRLGVVGLAVATSFMNCRCADPYVRRSGGSHSSDKGYTHIS